MQDVCTEDEIKTVATALQTSGMQAIGWNRVNLDDCWEDVARAADGSIQADPSRFPSGMKALTDWLHARNFSAGIYTSLGYSVVRAAGVECRHRVEPLPGRPHARRVAAAAFA